MSFTDALKEAVKKTIEASAPAKIMFGVVTSADPLTITVENRLTVSGAMLVVPKELRAGYSDTHKHKLFPPVDGEDAETGDVAAPEGGGSVDVEAHTHTLPNEYWTNDEENTLKEREYHYGLKAGEAVILLRDNGGQRFLVVGRL